MSYRDLYIEGKNVTKIIKALSSDVRVKILELIEDEELNIQSLVEKLDLGKTTVLTHVNILEEAGFITTRYVRGSVGNQKICTKIYDRLIYNFSPHKKGPDKPNFFEISTNIGNYFDFEIYPPCGLASKNNVIKKWDDPSVFYDTERVKTSNLWCAFGFVEYKIPIHDSYKIQNIFKIEITLEVSAQSDVDWHKELSLPNYLTKEDITDGISDVSFWINDIEIGAVTVKDYSKGSGGKYTPTWWKGANYGRLITITIDANGTFIDDEQQSTKKIDKYNITNSIRLRVGNKKDAKNISGFHIFGSDFGNYPNDIVLKIYNS